VIIIIIRIIYLLNKAIEKKYNNMNSRAGQQGKGTASCPEIRELHKTIQQTKIIYLLLCACYCADIFPGAEVHVHRD